MQGNTNLYEILFMKSKQGDLDFLKIAVGQAKLSIDRGGFPAGSVIVKNNEVIAKV